MRLAVVGNQDNNAYRLCKWMRELGVDVDLFLMSRDLPQRALPQHVDRELAKPGAVLPAWIQSYDDALPFWFLRDSPTRHRIMADYDLVMTTGLMGVLTANHFRGFPHVHFSLGVEVTELPLRWRWLRTRPYDRLISLVGRRGLRAARAVVSGYRPTLQSLQRQGLGGKTRVYGYPEDVEGNLQRVDSALLDELNQRYRPYDRVLLWLSRMNFRNRDSSSYKGAQHFIETARRLIVDDKLNLRVIIGEHGEDIEACKKLVREGGFEQRVEYVPHLPYWQLLTYLKIENAVVCDEIDAPKGELSGMAREGLSVGAVVAKSLDRDLVGLCFGDGCPVVHIFDAASAYAELSRLACMNTAEFRGLQQASLNWARQHLDFHHGVPKLMALLREALYMARA